MWGVICFDFDEMMLQNLARAYITISGSLKWKFFAIRNEKENHMAQKIFLVHLKPFFPTSNIFFWNSQELINYYHCLKYESSMDQNWLRAERVTTISAEQKVELLLKFSFLISKLAIFAQWSCCTGTVLFNWKLKLDEDHVSLDYFWPLASIKETR